MKIGVVLPQTEIGADPAGVRDYAQAVEEMGYTHILAYDHVLGASIENRPDWRGSYDSNDMFHEPLVLFGYLAGLTQHVELVTGILILPQRQTALVAKQAAEVDILSGGRLRLGVGIGWNQVERTREHPAFGGVAPDADFYFVHSYAGVPSEPDDPTLATTTHGGSFVSAVARGNLLGVQVHPERSGDDGLRLLANVVALAGASVDGATVPA